MSASNVAAEDGAFAGIDVGTATTKAVVINADKEVLGSCVRRSGTDLAAAATAAFEEAMAQAGVIRDAIRVIVATGYGRRSVPFAHEIKTEISCHGRGCYHYFPEAITVVDIGGQDNKIIKLDAQGRRIGFKMNRKCAAGTGAFLEEMAYKMDIPLSTSLITTIWLIRPARPPRSGAIARFLSPRRCWTGSGLARGRTRSFGGCSTRSSSGSWRWTP